MHICGYVPPWLCKILSCMGGLKSQAQTMDKDNRPEDFWDNSAIDVDHSATQSQTSISSIIVSNHPSDPQSSDAIQTDPPEFVNHGLLLWKQIRQQRSTCYEC
ncbi:unnamed protein product [Vicia faba]|uniref:Gag1-like clamp domain-containing protein n=1 Tax=Vicia faba TaxID=3906 RepID=A0AAV0Z810_VICFA|nr:unnamed protein product [Vicia faba]